MASAVDPSSTLHSVRPARNVQAAWSHIVRGEQEQKVVSAPSSPSASLTASRDSLERSVQKSPPESQPALSSENHDHVNDGNGVASRGKKLVWNVPSNGSAEGGAVMDATSWPALSEAARAYPKSSSSESLKGLSDGSNSGHLGSLSPPSKPVSNTSNPGLSSNPSASNRNKPMKHVSVNAANDGRTYSTTLTDKPFSGSGGAPNGGLATPSFIPALSQAGHPVSDKQSSSELSSKVLTNKSNIHSTHSWDNASRPVGASPQPHGGNDHHRGYGGGRRGNNGHHNNYGNRRDPDRGGYEWNNRNFVRDAHMQQLHTRWGLRQYSRPPTVAAQLIGPPPPPRPFSHNMGFPDMSSFIYYVPAPPHPESLRGLPFAPHPAPPPLMFFNAPDPHRAMLLKQIDYYFSPENLFKDGFLRQQMDEQGWVPVSLIASFKRVMQLTNHIQYNTIQYIIDTMRLSSVVEIQGDKIRRRNDWSIWAPKTANRFGSSTSGAQSPTTNYEALAAKFHNVGLENISNHSSIKGSTETVMSRSASGDLDSQQSVIEQH